MLREAGLGSLRLPECVCRDLFAQGTTEPHASRIFQRRTRQRTWHELCASTKSLQILESQPQLEREYLSQRFLWGLVEHGRSP